MKTPLFLLVLLLLCAATFAQTKLADELPALVKARNANAEAFFRDRLAPDAVFIARHDGSRQNKDYLMSLFKNQKSQTVTLSDVNIQQSGDLAVATGISTIVATSLDGSKTNTYKDAFTYTLLWMNNQWIFTNLHHTKLDYK